MELVGASSAFILRGLMDNGSGALISVDPDRHERGEIVGLA